MKKIYFLFFCLPILLLADENDSVSSDIIDQQLEELRIEFLEAKESFLPWYSGPLLTGSASTLPVGKANTQPYVFVIDNHARYNNSRNRQSLDDLVVVNPLNIFQFGIWPSADFVLNVGGVYQVQNSNSGGGYSDTTVQLGLQLADEGLYTPAAKLYVIQSFPSGKFQRGKERKQGLDITGNGSYITSLSFNTAKVIWWMSTNPMNVRLTFFFDVYSSDISVNGINAYGGVSSTNGKVQRGHEMKLNFGYEASLSKKIVFALDVAYAYQDASIFQGNPGQSADGTQSSVGAQSNDSLSLAPALEYNIDSNSGLLAGLWFSVYGRNQNDFLAGIFTYQVTF